MLAGVLGFEFIPSHASGNTTVETIPSLPSYTYSPKHYQVCLCYQRQAGSGNHQQHAQTQADDKQASCGRFYGGAASK